MKLTMKWFYVTTFILTSLQLADAVVSNRVTSRKQSTEHIKNDDYVVPTEKDNKKLKIITPTLKVLEKQVNDNCHRAKNVGGYVNDNFVNAKNKLVEEMNSQSQKDAQKPDGVFKKLVRTSSRPARAFANVGKDVVLNKYGQYSKNWREKFDNRDKVTPEERKVNTTLGNTVKRVLRNPIPATMATADVVKEELNKGWQTTRTLMKVNDDTSK